MSIENLPDEIIELKKEVENSSEMKKILESERFIIQDAAEVFRSLLTPHPYKLIAYAVVFLEKMERNPYFISRFLQAFFLPLLYRFGTYFLKNTIEEKIVGYIYPKQNMAIEEFLKKRVYELKPLIDEFSNNLHNTFLAENINAVIESRFKSKFQILREVLYEEKNLEELLKIFEIKVLVSEKNLYSSIGIIHNLYKPVPQGFKDFVAVPKHNGYRALHTLVINSGYKTEVIVCTDEMNLINNYGVLKSLNLLKEAESFLNELIDYSRNATNTEFINALNSELEYEYVYVLTPKNDVIRLPLGSTLLDFAYKIHTEVGRKAVYGKIDGNIVTLNHILTSGSVCEVITSPNAYPKPEHLKFVKTQRAKESIKKFLK